MTCLESRNEIDLAAPVRFARRRICRLFAWIEACVGLRFGPSRGVIGAPDWGAMYRERWLELVDAVYLERTGDRTRAPRGSKRTRSGRGAAAEDFHRVYFW